MSPRYLFEKMYFIRQKRYLVRIMCIFFQVCPTGVVNEHTFKDIFASYFPQGGKTTFIYLIINVTLFFNPFDMLAIYIHTLTFYVMNDCYIICYIICNFVLNMYYCSIS